MALFRALAREAKGWLARADEAHLAPLAAKAAAATSEVPEARRADWERLVAGFAKSEPAAKRRARVEGLIRACTLFGAAASASATATASATAGASALRWVDPVDRIKGMGPAAREGLAKFGVTCVADLVWTLPVAFDDARTPISPGEAIARAKGDALGRARVCLRGTVKSAAIVPMRGRRAVRVAIAGDDGAAITAWWFFMAHGVLAVAKAGAPVIVTGRVAIDGSKPPRMAHPDLVRDEESARVVRPRYPRLGVAEGALRKGIAHAMGRIEALPDPVPAAIVAREAMPAVDALLAALHGREGAIDAPPDEATRRAAFERLAWAEAFTRVWERLTIEARDGAKKAHALPIDRAVVARLRAELGFSLTAGQEKAAKEIARDLAQPLPMRRLLLGDVGTGKTAVALAAAAQCVAAGRQVAILAPTSVLAEQYMDAVGPLARATGASVALVAAGVPAAQRRRLEEGLARGDIAVAVGTHALLREGVSFAKLGLVIVDEQHRLGVAQRLALVGKGEKPHLLTLSATPIPRTLALALRGELRTCELDERPKGRPAPTTEVRGRSQWASVVDELRAVCTRGERAFVVAPTIEAGEAGEDDEADDASGAVALAEELARALAPAKVALVHGALPPDEKRRVMRAFRAGEAQVLVGTTVVEVGIDVPEATLMVVDGAERFGLAQLHQLRGRVGRGAKPGRCVLVHAEPLEGKAAARLEAMTKLDKGIDVARADLALRGAGDLGGTRQSGVEEELLYLDPSAPPAWLERIEADARAIVKRDPELASEEHRALAIVVRRLVTAIAVREEAG